MSTEEERITLEYTPEAALELLMRKLTRLTSELAARVQTAMDEGKDIQEVEPSRRRGKKKSRVYRRSVPYTDEEALVVATKALEAYFVQQPLFTNSLQQNMAKTMIGEPRRSRYPWEKGQTFPVKPETEGIEKQVAVEIHTETQLRTAIQVVGAAQEMQSLAPVGANQLEEQRRNLSRLRALVTFGNR
jgi:hypothetical protein